MQMSAYQEPRYYVYMHVDPRSLEVMYVGKGTRSRAWTFSRNTSGGRSLPHFEYLVSLETLGYTANQWAQVVEKNLTNAAALKLELSLIDKYRPKLNGNYSRKTLLTQEDVTRARELHKAGMSFERLGKEFGVSTMTAFRSVVGETKKHAN